MLLESSLWPSIFVAPQVFSANKGSTRRINVR